MQFIPVSGPSITQKEIDYVTDAVTNAWYGDANIYHDKFERAFANYLGVKYAIALPSCTSAIHLSLLALGITTGDEVIVPDVTWIASAAPINYVGATPVFADIDPQTWCISAESLESYITPKTKAIIPVNLYGGMPDMDAIIAIAKKYNLAVIEDAAESIGSEYHGRKAGSFGDTGVFSFHGSKTLTTGEGGMLVTDREDIYQRVLFLRDHGRKPGDKLFYNTEVGYKYKMSSMQAALGLAQLERIEELIDRKRQIFRWYQSELDCIQGLTLNYEPVNTKNTYWMVTIIIDDKMTIEKNQLMDELRKKNIDTRPFFHPLSSLLAYEKLANTKTTVANNRYSYKISQHGINLPSGMNMDREKIIYICQEIKKILA
ncbi:DegT/DnrJ/EryC1/StrS family aminotransferase [Chamaesiphon minutus]|uniref:Putative PLP-dependent enzyme possibly involved in cell wall biogenesis n=1 Tax=Chamaesiphon minutus (strain ATCC 27169 / PCC 6605) TaxID=1173020 RepID=K9UKE0_CHAP6|nr:DegT/DnrJ/EryC1/StrS family aminotransferase [Chamaesiphon minutus]AFY94669.1 putative PLP-dependent enzyme possibly involved in cell wall biogenesis [Chamaesiphon minutus PCC 6605]